MGKKEKNKDKSKNEGKKNTSLRLDSKTLKALKIAAIENNTSVQQIIETLVAEFLRDKNPSPSPDSGAAKMGGDGDTL